MCAHTCVKNPHTCVRHAHTFCTPSCLSCLLHVVSFTWESSWLTHVWEAMLLTPPPPVIDMSPSKVAHTCVSIFPPLNGQNPNPCGAYLASTSLILRDPSPPSCIRSQPSISSLICYKRRAPLLIFISNLKANVMLLNWWTTTFHGVMKLSTTW